MAGDLEYELTDTEPPREEDGYVAFVWERHFFNAFLTKYGTVAPAAEYAGVTLEMVERRAAESAVFRLQLELCREKLRDTIRHEVIRRALEPERTPVFSKGRVIGYVEKWDNRHLEWVAERLLPEEFHLPSRVEAGSGGELELKLELGPGVKKNGRGAEQDNDGGRVAED